MQRLIVKVRSSLLGYWEVILIYPALFLYIFSNDLNLISQSALIYRKLCLHEYNETICNSIHSHTKESNRVQELTSQFQIILNVAFMAPAILSLIHLSSLADRRLNYEIPLVVSLIGSLAQALVCIFVPNADFELAYYLLILSQVVNGICGAGSLAFISSCFSHVANYESRRFLPRSDQAPITSSNNSNSLQVRSHRSIRYSICESCNLLGQFIGSIASGHLIGDKLNLKNFESVYIISFSLYFVVLIYTVAMFRYLKWRERRLTQTNNNNSSTATSSSSDIMSLNTSDYLEADFQIVSTKRVDEDIPNQINGDNHQVAEPSVAIAANNNSRCSCFKNQLKFLEETWQLLRKPRPNNARFIIISLLVLFFLGCSISMGIMANQYLYVIKKPIQLSQVDYGYFKAYNTLCRALALLVVLPMLKKFLNAPDYLLFILGFTSEFLNLVFFSLAYFFKYFIWIAPISYMFSNYFVVCIRSYSSKLVDKHETGKYFGLIGVTEFLVLLTSSSLFSFIYSNTVSFFPPFVFLLGCGISIVICYPFLIYIIRELKRYHLSDTETQ